MNKQQIEDQIRGFVKLISPSMPEDFDSSASLMLAPMYFTQMDMVYLLILVMENFPKAEITAKDLEERKFKSVSAIADLLVVGPEKS